MAIHIMRDFSAAATGYTSTEINAFFTPQIYTTSLFLNKVLGYSVVGQTGWDINNTNVQTSTATATTAIAATSNGVALPTSTINVTSTTGFPVSGIIFVSTNAGIQIVTYSGTTTTSFLNCAGGTGTMTASSSTTITAASNGAVLPQAIINVAAINTANTLITAASNGVALPTGTINVTSTTGFPTSGTLNVTTTNGVQTVTYTGVTALTFTGCSGGTGNMATGNAVNNTGFFTPFATSGNIFVVTTSGVQTVAYSNPSTTIAVGSNNVTLPTGTINVISTTGFPTTGAITVVTTNGPQTVTYTNTVGGTQFTGCTGGTGTMNTGNSVRSATSFGGASGGIGTINTNNAVTSSGGAVACSPLIATGANGPPPTITTNFPHGLTTGQIIGTTNISGNFPTGVWQVTVLTPTTFLLMFNGTASFTGNGTVFPPGMLLASGSLAGGTGASINFAGAPSVYAVQVPTTLRTVVSGTAPSIGDVGRLLVLKSRSYPTKNSGIFKITAVNTATNSYTVDYRSSDTPPPESGTIDWWLYETEVQVSHYLNWPNQSRINVGLTATTNTAPIQCTANTNVQIPLITGMRLNISGVTGNTNANGNWTITIPNPTTSVGVFTLNGSVGNGTSGSVGTITRLGYSGDGYAINSKIILQSPHSTGWQVRLCAEPWNVTGNPNCTMSVGYGGTSTGDFPIGGTHTHVAQFLDGSFTSQYANASTGNAQQGVAYRINLIGDDGGQSVCLYARTLSTGSNGIILMGIPDNEPSPAPVNTNRPFIYGCASATDMGTIQLRWGASQNVGFTYRDTNPEMCGIAAWANADGVSGTSPTYSANAGDCPFTGTTEVLPLEVWGGIATDPALSLPFPAAGQTVYNINQRFMGTAPTLRQGRTNFGTFTLSTDNVAAFTVSTTSGNGVSPIQITTSAINALATGQTVVISGVTGNTNANGTFVITVINNTNFTLNGTTGNANFISGGSGNGTATWLHLQNGIYLAWNGASGLTP